MEQRKYDLEDRLINFTSNMIDIVEMLPNSRTGNYLAGQMIRSCHSPSFNYGKAQAAEIIDRKNLLNGNALLAEIRNETEQLIAIVAKSIQTTQKNSAS